VATLQNWLLYETGNITELAKLQTWQHYKTGNFTNLATLKPGNITRLVTLQN
jgi:hypothetical protein